ncbi:DUF1653 domain-containing protein [Metabacillus indicus]|uniref:DUF1653 domain-containing protein n=1 Tax=Metabacillus indicus TaxID=246786 RepID=UPI0029FFC0D8|nr:DUF1653 domain-containing protein [Metabacillus indicus]MDX8288824.1 DUF1653 domain-containing protein [Metabacillus indicus]
MQKYKHYKGTIYELICIATHSENDEKLVIYQSEEGKAFARPYDMFFEKIEINGKSIPRFEEIKQDPSQ